MRKQDINEDTEPLIESEKKRSNTLKSWDTFRMYPTKINSGSTDESNNIEAGIKFLKCFTVIFTFSAVLGMGVISKGTLLFMTSQIKNITRPYCNKDIEKNQRFQVTLPTEERVVWMWMIIFAYMIPEVGTVLKSVRKLSFKTWKSPNFSDFILLFITELLPVIGSAILVFVIFPELDVIKAVMLTNAMCFVPGFVAFFSRSPHSFNDTLKILLDIAATIAQASAFVIWPLITQQNVLYLIPVSGILISFGWWENFLSEKSPKTFISKWAATKKEFKIKRYYMYAIIAPFKCLVFLVTTVVILVIQGQGFSFLFSNFIEAFKVHSIKVNEIGSSIVNSNWTLNHAIASGYGTVIETSIWTPLSVWMINLTSTYLCYAFGKWSCKIAIQSYGFALPISLVVPVLLTALIAVCGTYNKDDCAYADTIPSYLFFNAPSISDLNDFISQQYSWVWLLWLFSQCWITMHIWTNSKEKLASTEKLFFRPMYDPYLIDQSLALNRRREEAEDELSVKDNDKIEELQQDTNKDKITRIYACGTMWHETKEEMVEFLKSIFRMDEDQSAQRIVRNYLNYNLPNYYELETHVLFDDAFARTSPEDKDPHVNQYVLDLIDAVGLAANEVHMTSVRIRPPVIYSTPYGGRLVWTLPGKTKMIAHLKDKTKIRAKKRWSLVMYMYYLLGHRIMENDDITPERAATISENTYLLALDGDIDFHPHAVHLLVQCMNKYKTVGAACGRIYPVGFGAVAWYQIFEYAMGHWLQKATEHIIGCIVCSPGCFSLFRAKALMDDNVMAKYTTVSEEARHFIQYEQGEDRWLCTLLLQRGYRVEYCAGSDSYTHCPEGLDEFYKQRRRWTPSTVANDLDLIINYRHIMKLNDNISFTFIIYKAVLMLITIIGPGTIFLMMVHAFMTAFNLSHWISFVLNAVPILIFVIVCATCKEKTQLFLAGVMSILYTIVMMAVLVGILIQIKDNGWLAPSSLLFLSLALEFVIAALLHPQEFYCLKYGIIYYVTVPSMYMLLIIYTIFNMNNVSWGTREPQKGKEDTKEEKKPEVKHKIYSLLGSNKDNSGSFEFSFAGLFKIICCTHEANGEESQALKSIQASLLQTQQKLEFIERKLLSEEPLEQSKATDTSTTTYIEGPRASRASSFRNSTTHGLKKNLNDLEDNDNDSIITSSEDLQENSWFYDGPLFRSEVSYLGKKEENFWEALIEKYLRPIDDIHKKDKVEKDLKDLRDKLVIAFLMLNVFFIVVVLLLAMQQELHVNWPINPNVSFAYIHDQNMILMNNEYIKLEPTGIVLILFFLLLMGTQFIAMIIHRFGTFSQIMANTFINWDPFKSNKVENLTENGFLEQDLIKVLKELMKLQGINDDDDDSNDAPVIRRNTVHTLALNNNKKKKKKTAVHDLDKAFCQRMKRLDGSTGDKKLSAPGKLITAITNRRKTIENRRNSITKQMSQPPRMKDVDVPEQPIVIENDGNLGGTFNEPTLEESNNHA